MATLDEQETTVNVPAKGIVQIWTNVAREITSLRKKVEHHKSEGSNAVRIVRNGFDEDNTEWVMFEVDQAFWSSGRGVRGPKRELSEAQRAELRDRLAQSRA